MRIMLATPTQRRYPTLEYLMSLTKTINLAMQRGHMVDTAFVGGDAFIGKARNGLVQTFIETWKGQYPSDVLVFLDDDQGWDELGFVRVCESAKEFVGVVVPKKADGEPQTFNNVMLDTDDKGQCHVENGLMRASQIGSGFIALKRACIEKMIAAYPQRYAPGDGGAHPLHYNLFEPKIIWDEKDPTVIGQFWGEDLLFCKKWCALGESIWIDPNVRMEHVGRKSWHGNFMEFLQKYAAVTVTEPFPDEKFEPIPETLATLERMANA